MNSAVSARALSKKYGDFLALDSVSLEVEEGKVFAILGPNGAGKTTLMRILTTQLAPTAGEAFVLGKNVASESAEVRKLVSYVPQEMSVWTDISGYENLLIYAKIYGLPAGRAKKAIDEALELMDLTEFSHHLVSTYSGGMARKLELASAIMLKPRIVFLDEPTIGLDPATRKTVWDKLKSLNREFGTNVFFSTHYMDEAENYADEIGILNKGRLAAIASPEELKHSVADGRIEVIAEKPVEKSALNAFRRAAGAKNVELGADGRTLRISVAGKAGGSKTGEGNAFSVDDTLEFIVRNKIRVKRVSTLEPSMDDVFLKYAGASDGGASAAVAEAAPKRGRLAEFKSARERIRRG